MANDSKQQHRLFSVTGVMVATLVAIVGVVFAFQHGLHYGTVSTAWSALWGYAIAAVGAVAAGLIADRNNAEEKKRSKSSASDNRSGRDAADNDTGSSRESTPAAADRSVPSRSAAPAKTQ